MDRFGFDIDEQNLMGDLGTHAFSMIDDYLKDQQNTDTVSHRPAVSTISGPNGMEEFPQEANGSISQNVISGFVRQSYRNRWGMVRFWESVDITRLDEIHQAGGDYEWHPLNYN